MSQSLGYENRCPSSGFAYPCQVTAAVDGGVTAPVEGAGASRVGAMPASVPGTTSIGVEPKSVLAAFPRGSITTIAKAAKVSETPATATAPPRDAGPGRRSQRAERWRRNRFQRIRSSSSRSSRRSAPDSSPPRRRVHSPPRWPVLDQVRPAVGEVVPTLLQAFGESVDPPLAPSLKSRGAPLLAGGHARSRPSSNGGSRQREEVFRHVHVRGLSTPSLIQTRRRIGQISRPSRRAFHRWGREDHPHWPR